MSGGFFNYEQYQINNVADELDFFLRKKDYDFSVTTVRRLMETIITTRLAAQMVDLADSLLSGDISEDDFNTRWGDWEKEE